MENSVLVLSYIWEAERILIIKQPSSTWFRLWSPPAPTMGLNILPVHCRMRYCFSFSEVLLLGKEEGIILIGKSHEYGVEDTL